MPSSIIDQIRQQQAWQQPKKASIWPLVLGAVVAFLCGAGGIYALNKVRLPSGELRTEGAAPGPQAQKSSTLSFGDARVGRAETAPLLKQCVPLAKLGIVKQVDIAEVYRLLQIASNMSRAAAITGIKQDAVDGRDMATVWADVADCVYRQNGWAFCDPDNRALAVEAASVLSRQVTIAPLVKGEGSFAAATHKVFDRKENQREYQMQNARAVKDRVLSTLRQRIADGYLIAADFNVFTHEDVRRVINGTATTQNACATRG